MSQTVVSSDRGKTAVIVLGMHRSGTSAMARLLSIAGVALPANLMREAPDNPTGFWEPLDIVLLNDRIMGRFDSTWDDVFAGVRKPYLKELDEGLLQEAVETLKANYGDTSPIVLKDPRVAVLGDFWRRALDLAGYSVRYVIMVRNPLEVAASLSTRNGFSQEKSLLLWSSYMVAAERDTRHAPRIFVAYEDLLADWRGVLDNIEKGLAITLPRRTATASLESDQFLRPSLRHHVQNLPLDEKTISWPPLKTLYSWFSAASRGGAAPNTGPDQADEELAALDQLFGPILAETRIESRARAKAELDGRVMELELRVAERGSELTALRADSAKVEDLLRNEVEARGAKIASLEKAIVVLQADLENALSAERRDQEVIDALKLEIVEREAALARQHDFSVAVEREHEEERNQFARALESRAIEVQDQMRLIEELRANLRMFETEGSSIASLQAANADALSALRRQNERQEQLAEEIRMAAALESRTLKRHLHEQTEALRALQDRHHEMARLHSAVVSSSSWRLTAPLRQILGSNARLATALRNGAKLVYWTVTLQLPHRLRVRKAFFAAQADAAQGLPSPSAKASTSSSDQAAGSHAFEPQAPAAPARNRREHAWRTSDEPDVPVEVLDLYEVRTDDAVPREAERGRRFMERFGLLSSQPKFEEAVRYLNAKPRPALDPSVKPLVSVIVPVYGQLAYTLNCLDSLLDHAARARFEILIGDDVSPDASGVILPQVEGVRVIRHAENGGFILNCNLTAAHAQGDYLLFLNNDTRVVAGWLDELIGSFELFPQAGLVGSKLFYPDGTLQEAGGVIWRDGSAWNYGRDQDPNQPDFCYARQVDFISGASILLPRKLWDEFGGFDEHYKPAYCEDADLALRMRASGREVWMQPLSRVIHYEGRTSGTDLTQGVKAYQVVNMKKMFERWAPALAAHRPNAVEPHLEKDRNVEKRVLIIDAGTPTPDQDAGSVVTLATIRIYQALGYKVTFLPRDNFLFDPVYTQALQRIGVECLYAPFELNFTDLMRRTGARYDVVQVFRIGIAETCLEDIRRYAPQAPLIFHNVDLHYLRMERQAEVTGDAAIRAAAAEMKARELAMLDRVDCTIVTSPVEEAILKAEKPDAPIIVFPYLVEVEGTAISHEPRRDIMFLGGYRHTPNIDAAEWFTSTIWPRLADEIPEAKLLLIGAHPTDAIKALAGPRVEVPGMVADLKPYFDQARVFVAPIRYGAGIKGKVATSMAHGLPVVATSCAAEGMFMQDERDVLIADDVDGFVERVLRLYRDPKVWAQFSRAGLDFVAEHNSIDMGRRTVMSAIHIAADAHAKIPQAGARA